MSLRFVIPPRDSGEGGPRSCAVGGARASTLLVPRQRSVESDAPSTMLRMVPLPRFAGADAMHSRSRARLRRECCRSTMSFFSSPPGLTRWSMLICGNKAERNLNQPFRRMDCRIKSGNDEQIKERKWNAGRRTRDARTQRRAGRATEKAACAALPLRARSPAGVPLTALAAATERHRSAPVHALPGTELLRGGCYPPPAVPVQRAL
jgi:hypothetical protein